jgi:AcrR family transcriptional regulator
MGRLAPREQPRSAAVGRGLSVERIVDATLAVIDEQGIGAATMPAVAARLGVRAISLYKYFESRNELFDAVVDRVVNELGDGPPVEMHPTHGWRTYLQAMAHGVRRYARAHPHAFPQMAAGGPRRRRGSGGVPHRRLAAGLAADLWEQEFEAGLKKMLDRVEIFLAPPGRH